MVAAATCAATRRHLQFDCARQRLMRCSAAETAQQHRPRPRRRRRRVETLHPSENGISTWAVVAAAQMKLVASAKPQRQRLLRCSQHEQLLPALAAEQPCPSDSLSRPSTYHCHRQPHQRLRRHRPRAPWTQVALHSMLQPQQHLPLPPPRLWALVRRKNGSQYLVSPLEKIHATPPRLRARAWRSARVAERAPNMQSFRITVDCETQEEIAALS